MTEILRVLDHQLTMSRPDFYAGLNAPLTETGIDILEQQYGLTVPADLRLLYGWKNGQQSRNFAAFANNSMFVPLAEALQIAQENTAMIGYDFDIENWWHPEWIPIFQNGGGDSICYDMGGLFTGQPGQLIEFWHADNDRNVMAPSLESFLNQLVHYYDQTSPQQFDRYFEVDAPEGYPKSFVLS